MHKDLTVREAAEDKLNYRTLSIRLERGKPESLDEDKRSVEVVGATETPAEIFDWNRGIIKEILLIDGLEFPKNKQVPLLDTHKRWDTSSVLGSYRNMKRSDGQLLGKVYFSNAPEAEGPFMKLKISIVNFLSAHCQLLCHSSGDQLRRLWRRYWY